MSSIHETAKLLKSYHFSKLSSYEKKFINELLEFGGDGSDDPSDAVMRETMTPRMEALLRKIGKRFLITKDTK